jgi:hypothetical protein
MGHFAGLTGPEILGYALRNENGENWMGWTFWARF